MSFRIFGISRTCFCFRLIGAQERRRESIRHREPILDICFPETHLGAVVRSFRCSGGIVHLAPAPLPCSLPYSERQHSSVGIPQEIGTHGRSSCPQRRLNITMNRWLCWFIRYHPLTTPCHSGIGRYQPRQPIRREAQIANYRTTAPTFSHEGDDRQ